MTKTIVRQVAIRRAKRAIQRVCSEEIPPAFAIPDLEKLLIEAVSEALEDRQNG